MTVEVLNPLNQRVFATKETTAGTPVFPTPATDSIIAAGYVDTNRSVSYSDSPEIRNSLNIKDQVKDKDAAGEWNFPIIPRPAGYTGTTFNQPMGDVLFEVLIGRDQSGAAGVLNAAMTTSSLSIAVDGLSYKPKAPLVALIESELIFFDHIDTVVVDANDSTKFSAIFYSGERGYAETSVATHSEDVAITIKSHSYSQEVNRDTFTLWYMQDTIVYFCAGCSVSSLNFTGENKGYPMLELSGGFMTKGRVGQSAVAATETSGETVIGLGTDEAKYYSVYGRIWNETKLKDNTGSGYEIIAVDTDNDTITLGTAIDVDWEAADVIKPYLPGVLEIGSTLKSEDTVISLGTTGETGNPPVMSTKVPTALTMVFDAPIKYIDEEITPDAISEYTEERRAITGSLTQLMKMAELQRHFNADNDLKNAVQIRLGVDTDGYKCYMYMRRCTIQVPIESVSEPLIEQSMDYTALDDEEEDSFVLAFL
jgi:hypothetical protein